MYFNAFQNQQFFKAHLYYSFSSRVVHIYLRVMMRLKLQFEKGSSSTYSFSFVE